ncbi:hypothetical protein [Leifsonia poae]|uniref:hypothetical protein n=1 Tax=Leifsonia poae TaxID=110933 RepID=UPI003D67040F
MIAMDGEQADGRRSFLTPARLLAGSLIGGAGIALLGFFFGGATASAAEPAPPEPATHSVLESVGSLVTRVDGAVSGVVSSVTSPVGEVASAVVRPVANSLPAPTRRVASSVVAPVATGIADIVASAPVSQVTAPVTGAVDAVVARIPITQELLGDRPLGVVVDPVAGAVDHALGSFAPVVTEAVEPLTSTASSDGEAVVAAVSGGLGAAVAVGVAPTDPVAAVGQEPLLFGARGVHRPVVGSTGSSPQSPAPPGGLAPFAQGAVSGSGVSSSGSGAAGLSAATAVFLALFAPVRGMQGLSSDDRLPASAVADHDTSPD